jgi:hypothetical protein
MPAKDIEEALAAAEYAEQEPEDYGGLEPWEGSGELDYVPGTEPWTPGQQAALHRIVGPTLVRQTWVNSAEVLEMEAGEEWQQIPEAEVGLPAPGEAAISISSAAAGGEAAPERQAFWLRVNTEVVVFGATEPEAKVTIDGKPLQLRADGTFTVRFSLPDGKYRVAIMAVSTRGEVREARLHLGRGTEFRGEVGEQPQQAGLEPPGV